jgi:D-3-phosphoglycerate dehydrogenase
MTYKIKVMNKIAPEGLKLLEKGFETGDLDNPQAILVRSAKVQTSEYSELLAVARAGVGVNNVSVAEATEKGVCVFNTPGANANAVAELVFSTLGYGVRNIGASVDYVKGLMDEESDEAISKLVEANKSNFKGSELAGKTLCVIGLGKIGVLVSNYGVHHGMKVKAFDPYPSVANVHYLDSRVSIESNLMEAITDAEVVSVHVPLIEQTKNLIGEEEIAQAKTGCVLINFARDGIYNDDAVENGLNSGKVSRFISDFPKKRFISNDRAICLPHLGASTAESEENCAVMACEQMKNYLNLGNIVNSVNFPPLEVPVQRTTKNRNMIAQITQVIGEAGVNIQSFGNESNGTIGYNIIDTDADVPQDVLDSIQALENVVRVRLIAF